jgi:hypothetical protein
MSADDENLFLFTDLSEEQQEAAAVMGFDEDLWNSNTTGPYFNKQWIELTRDQKEAVQTLRNFYFNKEEWLDHLDEDVEDDESGDDDDDDDEQKPKKRSVSLKKKKGLFGCC